MTSKRGLIERGVGALLIIVGSVIWTDRLSFDGSAAIEASGLSGELVLIDRPDMDLSNECEAARSGAGWLMLVVNTELIADDTFRGYFETAPKSAGLFMEYDPGEDGILRLGMATTTDPIFVRLRTVRRDESAVFALLIRRDDVRIVSNAVDRTVSLPVDLEPAWLCSAVRVESSDGVGCPECSMELRYATGVDPRDAHRYLDALSNLREFNVKRWFGSGLSMLGVTCLTLIPLTRFRRRTRR